MKRLMLMVLALLLLCGCSTSKPMIEESITTEPTEPTTTEAPYDKEVLEGGVWVQTDYSKYEPNELTPKYTRLSKEHISALQPSDEYGMVYPFVGSRNISDYGELTRYGMMDASGCIVADAVYSDVELICADTQEETCLMWSLSKIVADDDAYPDEKTALATLDGSFITEHIYTRVSAYEEYVFAYIFEDEHTIVHVYDAQGNLCLNSEELPFHDRLKAYASFEYGGGLFVVELDEPAKYYFADWDGNLIYGPFDYASPYSDGYAVVKKYSESYAYLDKNGNDWLDMEFTNAESFYRGYAAASDDAGNQHLLSAKDGIVASVPADGASWDGSYFLVWNSVDAGWSNWIYSTEGELLHEWTYSNYGYYELIGSDELLYNYNEGKIVNLKTGEERFLGDTDTHYVNTFEYIDSFDRIPYFCVIYYEHNASRSVLFDASLCEIASTTGYFAVTEDRMLGKRYIADVNGKTQFFDMNAEPILTLPFSNCQIYNSMVLCYDDAASYYYDLEGNLLFCYPYIGIAGD